MLNSENIRHNIDTDYPRQPRDTPGVVFIGPSGAGKTTLRESLCQKDTQFVKYLPLTTRAKRPGEVEEYIFVDDMIMNQAKSSPNVLFSNNSYNNEFLTLWPMSLDGSYYAYIYLPEAALKLKKEYKNTYIVQVIPPSLGTLEKRIKQRDPSINLSELALRLASIEEEIRYGEEIADMTITTDQNIESASNLLLKNIRSKIARLREA